MRKCGPTRGGHLRLNYKTLAFNELSLLELYELLWLRDRVFVVGQKIYQESEIDGADTTTHHLCGRDESGTLIAYARIDLASEPAKVGRILIAAERRGEGLARELMGQVDAVLKGRRAMMHAQSHLRRLYETCGWTVSGDAFLEAEIPHLPMSKEL